MSTKLVVHKFETGINFKSLQITIDEGDDGSIKTRFSEWSEGKSHQKKKQAAKESMLIVKIISGNDKNFNLDSCAKILDDSETCNTNTSGQSSFNNHKENLMCYEINASETVHTSADFDRLESNNYTDYNNHDAEEKSGRGTTTTGEPALYQQDITSTSTKDLSPLEYSLERVKENNARIMENIHMLNRTLNYTKKKEILDIVRPKSMRYSCNTCGKCFVYETGLKRHYSMRHILTEMQPRWQVVWTCIECFQVWPRKDLAMTHSSQCCKSDDANCVREIKTSSLLQCEFCEKVYTSIPRLLKHSKAHTTANNYECNACKSTFQTYKAAEQHWLLCPWLKMCYRFSLPKMLLCNACDRKFKNYEQLYNHRYKVGHYMTKTHCNKGSVRGLGALVYQCEICGLWFPTISTLINHRSNHTIYDTPGIHSNIDHENNFETGEIDYQVNQIENMQTQQII